MVEKTLRLFNAVLAVAINKTEKPILNNELGLVIMPSAAHKKDAIVRYYESERLSGNDLNKTFHKSWAKIANSTRLELLMHQILHYFTTYGTNFTGPMYLPDEVLMLPDVRLQYIVVQGYSAATLQEKCLEMLRSGIALKSETINDLLSILHDTGYRFTGREGIRNKEAIVKIADVYGVYPHDTMEFFRYVVYRATGDTLLIKNAKAIEAIKASTFDPTIMFEKHGLERLAEIFNRFKPLFLAFKTKCPSVINRISKLSKTYHKPLVQNPLNIATSRRLSASDAHWLDNATPFALFKVIQALIMRLNHQDTYVYRIRNGKSWVTEDISKVHSSLLASNLEMVYRHLRNRFNFYGKKVYVPEDVEYALPTSEKMFVGNIPTGTRFLGDRLAVGFYWEDAWGAHDLDLSAITLGSKVGWNSIYNHNAGGLMYSGDIVSAPNGAVEYMYAGPRLAAPFLILNNVFSGRDDAGYKIIIGRGDDINEDYMMNPANLFAEVKCEAQGRQTILGLIYPDDDGRQVFTLLNFNSAGNNVSRVGGRTELYRRALMQQWSGQMTLREVLLVLGAEFVSEASEADIDLSLGSLERDTFVEMWK